jgi:hypothetical protein
MPQTLHYLTMIVGNFQNRIGSDDNVLSMLRGKSRSIQVRTEDGVFHFLLKPDGTISTPVEGGYLGANIKVEGKSSDLKEVAIGKKKLAPLFLSGRIKLDAGMLDIIIMKKLAGL